MRKGRLLKLAAHLDSDRVTATRFCMSHWRQYINGQKSCGTSGCAIGECPAVFPTMWHWAGGDVGSPLLRKDSEGTPIDDGATFFQLTTKEFYVLFYPGRQSNRDPLNHPDTGRGPKTVAAEIREFVRCGNVNDAVERVRERRLGAEYTK